MKISLFFRLFLAIGGCTSGAIFIALIVQNRSLGEDLEDAARQRIQGASRAAESLVANHIASIAAQYEVVARTPQLRATVDSGDAPTLTHYAQSLLTKERATQLAFLDPEGNVVASVGAQIFDPKEISESTLLSRGDEAFVAISTPLQTADRPLGRLVSIDPITTELIQSWTLLIGATVSFTPLPETFRGLTVEIDRFDPVPITIATTLERETASRLHARTNLLVAGLLALGVALIASFYFSRGFTRPILEIKQATEEIGGGDLSVRLEVARHDEIGDVAQSVNRMAERIQRSAHVIQHANESLLESNAQIAKARDRSEEESREKSEFIVNKEPALNESLGQISSALEVLSTSIPDDDPALRSARAAATRLGWQVGGLIDLARLEIDKLCVDTVDFHPTEIIEELTTSCAQRTARGVRVISAISPEAPATVRGDPHRVKQILSHLLRNSLEHTSSGEIVVGLTAGERRRDEVDLTFFVRDSGEGLDPPAIEALRASFSAGSSPTRAEIEGTGVGLPLCRRLVDQLGGSLAVERAAGGGATFSVTLPLPVTDWQNSKVLYALRAVDLDAVRVLVVDASKTASGALAGQIRAWGVTTEVENDPASFVARVQEASLAHDPFQIAFLHVPEWNEETEELLASIGRSARLRALRVVASSTIESLPTWEVNEAEEEGGASSTEARADDPTSPPRDSRPAPRAHESAPESFAFAARIGDPPRQREVLDAIIAARGGPRLDLRTTFQFAPPEETF